MSHVFISYSRTDSEYVEKLVQKLQAEGFDIWYDGRTDYGDEWWEEIIKAIEGCAAFIVVMTPESGKSRWVKREVMRADRLDKRQYALLLDSDVESSSLWAMFEHIQLVDVRDKSLPPSRFYDILARHAKRDTNTAQIISLSPQNELPPPPDLSSILPPPFEWCYISAGKVTIEYGKWNVRGYLVTTHKDFIVDGFYLSKYPITNTQYEVFVKSNDGYCDERWWYFSESAKAWRLKNPKPKLSTFDGADCPRTDISWYEAVAFCHWLDARASKIAWQPKLLHITLPTEQQWQRAAQGDDGRKYPWGNEFDKNHCNSKENNLGQTSPVQHFSEGKSPFGVFDMSGNVWEWCSNYFYYSNNIVNTKFEVRIARGGSWGYYIDTIPVKFRNFDKPDTRHNALGFRVAWVSPA